MSKANNQDELAHGSFANLNRLAYFAAVVETGSFTAAADRLGITKAVVSQQVARLEADFRTTLLTRTTRKVLPTEAVQRLYAERAESMHQHQALTRDAAAGLPVDSAALEALLSIRTSLATVTMSKPHWMARNA